MNPGDLCYIILGDEVVAITYLAQRSSVSHLIKRRTFGAGNTTWYGDVYATKRAAEMALFVDRLASP